MLHAVYKLMGNLDFLIHKEIHERDGFFFFILSQLGLLGSEGEKIQEKIRLRENSVMCIFG